MTESLRQPQPTGTGETDAIVEQPDHLGDTVDRSEGAASAAILAGGIGSAALGVLTVLAEASESLRSWLQWNDQVGPLSGKAGLAVLIWLVSWVVLHFSLRTRPYETRRAVTIALVLIAIGVIGTFPPFFQLFAPE